jgi:octaprenyl-diphosphate synthase
MTDKKQVIIDAVREDLALIETALKQNLTPYLDLVTQVAGHILFSGGKRLRPLLMILSARICGYDKDDLYKYAVIFEYLHAATLLHDDLIDGAKLRRGRPAAHLVWDNATAVLVGDFLLARAISMAAELGSPKIVSVISRITEMMSQGEIYQLVRKGALDITEEEYLDIIRLKTATLFQGACRASALMAHAAESMEKALAAYGYNLGIAFQMADDLLDYTHDSTILGKGVGADLKEGKITLPVIIALKNAASDDRRRIERIIDKNDFNEKEFQYLTSLLEKHQGIEYTRRQAVEYVAKAKEALAVFEPSKTKSICINIAEYALTRKS